MKISPPIARALRLSVAEGAMWAVYWNVVAGVIVNGLAISVGARPIHLAVLNALPLLGQVTGLFAARHLQERDARKPMTLLAEGVSRGAWLLVPLLVLLPEGEGRVLFLLAVAALSHLVHAAGAVGWVSWISDLVPAEIRGVFFGVRTAIVGVVGMLGLTFASLWADDVFARHGPSQAYLGVLLVLMGVAVAFAALSWFGLWHQPVRRMKESAEIGWRSIGRMLWAPDGRRLAVAWFALAFSAGITVGVFVPFFLERLHLGFTGFTAYAWIALLVSTATTPLLGRIGDRFGHRNLLLVAWLGIFWQPLLCVLTPDDMPHLLGLMPVTILIDAIFGGSFWPAVGIAQTNLVISSAPSSGRAALFAALSAVAGVAGFAGALAGGLLAEAIGPGTEVVVWGVVLDDLRIPMLVGMVLRTLAIPAILRIREPSHDQGTVSNAQAFTVVWRVVAGKPIRPAAR